MEPACVGMDRDEILSESNLMKFNTAMEMHDEETFQKILNCLEAQVQADKEARARGEIPDGEKLGPDDQTLEEILNKAKESLRRAQLANNQMVQPVGILGSFGDTESENGSNSTNSPDTSDLDDASRNSFNATGTSDSESTDAIRMSLPLQVTTSTSDSESEDDSHKSSGATPTSDLEPDDAGHKSLSATSSRDSTVSASDELTSGSDEETGSNDCVSDDSAATLDISSVMSTDINKSDSPTNDNPRFSIASSELIDRNNTGDCKGMELIRPDFTNLYMKPISKPRQVVNSRSTVIFTSAVPEDNISYANFKERPDNEKISSPFSDDFIPENKTNMIPFDMEACRIGNTNPWMPQLVDNEGANDIPDEMSDPTVNGKSINSTNIQDDNGKYFTILHDIPREGPCKICPKFEFVSLKQWWRVQQK